MTRMPRIVPIGEPAKEETRNSLVTTFRRCGRIVDSLDLGSREPGLTCLRQAHEPASLRTQYSQTTANLRCL